jgi:hypothetical protein
LPVDGFARDKSKANGRKSICKDCDRQKSRAYYAEHNETPPRNRRQRWVAGRGYGDT